MDDIKLLADNPFFINNIDKICVVCNRKLVLKQPIHSMFDKISNIKPSISIFSTLQSLSNFKHLNIETGPQKICNICYNKTKAALKFQKICDNSVSLLECYLKYKKETGEKQEILGDNELTDCSALVETLFISKTENSDTDLIDNDVDDNNQVYVTEENIKNKTTIENIHSNNKTVEIKKDEEDYGQTQNTKNIMTNNCGYSDIEFQKDNEYDSDSEQALSTSCKDKKDKCKFCHKIYAVRYLKQHMRMHTGERPYSCKLCHKKFSSTTVLKRHVTITHSNKRPFLCNTCGKSFKALTTYVLHSRTHNEERPYRCEICGNGFKARKTLNNHTVVHSNEKPFTCEVCGKCFSLRKHLRQHMISHAEVKRHACHLCGSRFTTAQSMRMHLLKYCKGGNNYIL